jgi:hypothetical protein
MIKLKASLLVFVLGMISPLVIASAFAFHCWNFDLPRQLSQRQRPLFLATTTSFQNETQSRVNYSVRNIMDDILSRYDRDEINDWTKTRSYVYRASDRLTTEQVEQVLRFLDALFPDDPNLVQSILQLSPRILRRNVVSNLQPTVKFLKELYGPNLFREVGCQAIP